jgi:thiol:disulfide interchange protein DsbC
MLRILVGLCIAGLSMTVRAEDLDKIKADLGEDLKSMGLQVEQVKPSPVSGLYEVMASGQVLYMSADGRYIFQGQLYDRVGGVNLTEQAKSVVNKKLLAKFDDSKTIVFSPKNPKYTVTVFTDTSCGYCRKLHSQMAEINKEGIKVRYMLFPRAGLGSPDAKTLESVWCAKNQQEALTIAKSGGQIPEKTCPNPIAEHVELARKLGLQGTPLMVTTNGMVIPGYLDPAELLAKLEQDAKQAQAN